MRIFYGCIFLLLYACGHKAIPGIECRNEVVIITDPAPDQSVGKMIIQGLAPSFPKDCITYLDSSHNETSYTPNKLNPDTLIIPAFTTIAEIRHRFKGYEMIRYAFFAGDTVSISYD